MDGWKSTPLGKIASLKYGKSLPTDARVPGNVPVYGSNGIVGWHDQAMVKSSGIIIGRKGTVGAVHYSPGPFCPIDTTYFIAQDDTSADLRFLAYLLQHAHLSQLVSDLVPGLNRDSALARIVSIPEDGDEQRRIAALLSGLQRVVARQERLVALTAELERAVMHRLFTHGTRGEPLRETDFGFVPQSWEVLTLAELRSSADKRAIVSGPFGSNIGKRFFVDRGVPLIRGCNLTKGEQFFVEEGFVFITEAKAQELSGCTAVEGDLIFTAAGTLGQVGLIPRRSRYPKYVISNKQLRARVDRSRIRPEFVFHWFASSAIQRLIAQRRGGASIPVINLGILKALPVPLPSIDEQDEIVDALATVRNKLAGHRIRVQSLSDLFRTLLHQLMTEQIRVRDLDLSALEAGEPVGAA